MDILYENNSGVQKSVIWLLLILKYSKNWIKFLRECVGKSLNDKLIRPSISIMDIFDIFSCRANLSLRVNAIDQTVYLSLSFFMPLMHWLVIEHIVITENRDYKGVNILQNSVVNRWNFNFIKNILIWEK